MADYTVTINTDNAAFGEPGKEMCGELARILHILASGIQDGGTGRPGGGIILRDLNGNKVGMANWK